MSAVNDGGPAFPSEQGSTPEGCWNQSYTPGMSLRDWFAGQALAGVLPVCKEDTLGRGQSKAQVFAQRAYEIADAMLAARKQEAGT